MPISNIITKLSQAGSDMLNNMIASFSASESK